MFCWFVCFPWSFSLMKLLSGLMWETWSLTMQASFCLLGRCWQLWPWRSPLASCWEDDMQVTYCFLAWKGPLSCRPEGNNQGRNVRAMFETQEWHRRDQFLKVENLKHMPQPMSICVPKSQPLNSKAFIPRIYSRDNPKDSGIPTRNQMASGP